ncbi:MAG: twin-arginine translocase TatA/TatE family subunit [Thermodesulfobacteriota bacterium]|nr:twin-arginine translocase TatA/TatE family subunit [Thermodesulfobacteriota bacterium]
MFGLGPTELIIIAIIILILFGAKRLPEIGKGLGGAIRELRSIKKELGTDETSGEDPDSGNAVKKNGGQSALEAKVVNKVFEQIPGAKKALEVKEKAENFTKKIRTNSE